MLRNSRSVVIAAQVLDSGRIRIFWQKPLLDHLRGAAAKVWNMLERRRQRRALLKLDGRLLQDVGLSRADIWQECSKPLWQR